MSEDDAAMVTHEELDLWEAIDRKDFDLIFQILDEFDASKTPISPLTALKLATRWHEAAMPKRRGRPYKGQNKTIFALQVGAWFEDEYQRQLANHKQGKKLRPSRTQIRLEAEEIFESNKTDIEKALTEFWRFKRELEAEGHKLAEASHKTRKKTP